MFCTLDVSDPGCLIISICSLTEGYSPKAVFLQTDCCALIIKVQRYSETWTIKARNARRIIAAETKYVRRTAGYTGTDYKINTQIVKELKITQIVDKLLEYKRKRLQHVIECLVINYPG